MIRPIKPLFNLNSILQGAIFTFLLLSLGACSEIFEGDLDQSTLDVITPSSSYQSYSNQVQFVWEELEDATSYKLRLVEPDFNQIQVLHLDTAISKGINNYSLNLEPGTYAWQMRAENSITYTDWVTGSLQIDSTTDVSSFTIDLLSPQDQAYLSDSNLNLSWEEIYSIDYFSLQVDYNGSLETELSPIQNAETMNTFNKQGSYIWSIKGHNTVTNTETVYFSRSFITDWQAPSLAVDLLPLEASQVSLSEVPDTLLQFSWKGSTYVTGSEAPVYDILYLSSSSSFVDADTFRVDVQSAQRTLQLSEPSAFGAYYWRVDSKDEAGNMSGQTAVQQFEFIP